MSRTFSYHIRGGGDAGKPAVVGSTVHTQRTGPKGCAAVLVSLGLAGQAFCLQSFHPAFQRAVWLSSASHPACYRSETSCCGPHVWDGRLPRICAGVWEQLRALDITGAAAAGDRQADWLHEAESCMSLVALPATDSMPGSLGQEGRGH